jgi:hypothetical protein
MDFNELITFGGGINTDDTPQGMPKGDYRDFSYCRLGYNSGNAYAVETSDGTLIIPNPGVEVQDQIIGATKWLKQNAIVYFVFKADLNHQIWVYYIDTQSHEEVITSSELNFSRDWPIYHANVVDDILKWTDGRWDDQMYDADGNRLFNPPYQINIQKAIDNFYTTVDLQAIDAVKWPLDPPFVSYATDTTRQDNKLRKKLYRFIIQPIYENGEEGVWSMYSNLPFPTQSELLSGTNFLALNNDNAIDITFNTGPKIVRKIKVAYQQYDQETNGAVPPFGVFFDIDKDVDPIADNVNYTYRFYGNVATKPAINEPKNYDRLPVVAFCQEYLPTNQLVYSNFREGYDKIDIVTPPPGALLPTNASYNLREIPWNPFSWPGLIFMNYPNTSGGTGTFTFQASDLYNVVNDFGYQAGLIFYTSGPTEENKLLFYQVSQQDIDDALALSPVSAQNVYMHQLIGDAFMDQLGWAPGTASLAGISTTYTFTSEADNDVDNNPLVRVTIQTNPTPSLKVGATHQFGIVYGDRAYRDGTVYTSDNLNLFVPWFYDDPGRAALDNPENPYIVNGQINIFHQPPIWADRYWIVAKPATEILSFGHYMIGGAADYPEAVTADNESNNRFVIELDSYWPSIYKGAQIFHQIKKGDRVRFIRKRAEGLSFSATPIEYLPYLELEVLEYLPASGSDGPFNMAARDRIYVSLFSPNSIEPDLVASLGNLFGQLIEIYTPRPAVDEGGLFISTWQDVTDSLSVLNPHTDGRVHGIKYDDYTVQYRIPKGGIGFRPFIAGDVTGYIEGYTWNYEYYQGGAFIGNGSFTVTGANYSVVENRTYLTIAGPANTGTPNDQYFITRDRVQIWDTINDEVVQNAIVNLAYGDVYVKARRYKTGLISESAYYYYYIEDPNYSDYWLSDIHQTGRFRIQDPNAKMTHRQATSIHSNSFILGTQINGLSTFALDNTNIEDMNPIFGGIIRTFLSGREGKTLKCLQPKKENSLYIQYYPNEVGSDSSVRVSNKTFSSWFDYKSLFGCSNAGASAILPDGTTIYFDNNSGVFVYSGANGQILVSEIDADSGKDYKFRTKTKALAAAYNASPAPVVRTYVNETVGEVGFAFRFDIPYSGEAQGVFNPSVGQLTEGFVLFGGNYEYLYGYDMIIYFAGTDNTYSGKVNFVEYQVFTDITIITLEGVEPDVADYLQPGYYRTTSGLSYDHVVFDYVNMRWRSTYDYNFQQFCNLGQTLVGWGVDNQLYLHNQPEQWNFHGDPFIQKVSFVSNEQPMMLKRYQDITLISDDLFAVEAQSEPNRSYPLGMNTNMPTNLMSTYEGYGKVYYRKNLYDPKFLVDSNTSTTSYDPPLNPINGWILQGDQTGLLNDPLATPPIFPDIITIIQDDGNIYTGQVSTAVYDPGSNTTTVTLVGAEPGTIGETGTWYFSEIAMYNGQDIRANALTHTLSYDPTINGTGSILVSVGIKGVLS